MKSALNTTAFRGQEDIGEEISFIRKDFADISGMLWVKIPTGPGKSTKKADAIEQ